MFDLRTLPLISAILEIAKLRGECSVDFDRITKQPAYYVPGDLLLGAILPVHQPDKRHVRCGSQIRGPAVQSVEALAYAVGTVNANPRFLPGIKLGLVVLEDCATPEIALAQALRFVPLGRQADDARSYYDVIGVLGSESSESSMMIAHLFGMFRIPQISALATSDRLSNKQHFPYFLRTVPPDHFQVEAILHLLMHFNWTHVSTVHAKGGYGEGLVEQLRKLAAEHGICVGVSLVVSRDYRRAAFADAARALHAAGSRVVVMLADKESAGGMLRAVAALGLAGHFIWIGSDGLGMNMAELGRAYSHVMLGSLSLRFHSAEQMQPGFRRYWESLTPRDARNPWFREMWAELHECSWNSTPRCTETDTLMPGDYEPDSETSRLIDTVYVFAIALHNLIADQCSSLKTDMRALRVCIKGREYLKQLLNISLAGYSDNISFDENGDVMGKYEIFNFRRSAQTGNYETASVAMWDSKTQQLQIDDGLIEWRTDKYGEKGVPLSSCGDYCSKGHIYSYFKNTCCWVCRRCNPNEVTAKNATECEPCPPFTWPDERTVTTCNGLPVHHIRWFDPVVILFAIVALVGVSCCSVIFGVYVKHNEQRLIKATSRELSYVMLFGVLLQFIALIGVVSRPSDSICALNFAAFNISFAVVYAALLTRTNRIYRIFRSGMRTKSLPRLASPCSQVVISFSLVAIQVFINAVIIFISPPEARLRMPVASEPYVEVACWLPQRGFISSLFYNLLLVVVCAGYAFKTRSLPNNFNESKYIMLCVYTTLVIWLAFLPTYFTTTQAFVEVVLLSSALALSATVTLLCLYLPKVYAVCVGVNDDKKKYVSMFNNTGRYGNHTLPPPLPLQSRVTREDEDMDDIIAMDLTIATDADQQTTSMS